LVAIKHGNFILKLITQIHTNQLVNLFLVWANLRRKGVKMHHPEIKAFNWIDVGGCQCVVMAIYSADSNSGVCKLVFNKAKSTTRDVDWDGQKWFFQSGLISVGMVGTVIPSLVV